MARKRKIRPYSYMPEPKPWTQADEDRWYERQERIERWAWINRHRSGEGDRDPSSSAEVIQPLAKALVADLNASPASHESATDRDERASTGQAPD